MSVQQLNRWEVEAAYPIQQLAWRWEPNLDHLCSCLPPCPKTLPHCCLAFDQRTRPCWTTPGLPQLPLGQAPATKHGVNSHMMVSAETRLCTLTSQAWTVLK